MALIQEIQDKLQEKSGSHTIIFVHGIASNLKDWRTMVKTISHDNYCEIRIEDHNEFKIHYDYKSHVIVWNISFYTRKLVEECLLGNLTEYAQRLENCIGIITRLTGNKNIILVAHSMGGLVARKYMTLQQENWNHVHKILTVGTPHAGVSTSINLVGQLRDLKEGSEFIETMDHSWAHYYNNKKWGVIGAVDLESPLNMLLVNGYQNDSAGPGYVALNSSIPFGEWKDAVNHLGTAALNTEHFGYRLAVDATHRELLTCDATLHGILWALD